MLEGDSILPPLRPEPAGSSDSDGSDADDSSYARGRRCQGGLGGSRESGVGGPSLACAHSKGAGWTCRPHGRLGDESLCWSGQVTDLQTPGVRMQTSAAGRRPEAGPGGGGSCRCWSCRGSGRKGGWAGRESTEGQLPPRLPLGAWCLAVRGGGLQIATGGEALGRGGRLAVSSPPSCGVGEDADGRRPRGAGPCGGAPQSPTSLGMERSGPGNCSWPEPWALPEQPAKPPPCPRSGGTRRRRLRDLQLRLRGLGGAHPGRGLQAPRQDGLRVRQG